MCIICVYCPTVWIDITVFAFIDKLSSIYQYISIIYIYDTYSNVMGGLLKADRCVNWLVQQWDHLRLMRARDP